jgi:hypothetical protein
MERDLAAENQEQQKDQINYLQWKNELIKDSPHIVEITLWVFGRVIIPSAQKQKNLLAKLQPHCFGAWTLRKKCWSSDFWCNHFYRERNSEDD